jgi:hypothetical protein
MSSTESSTENQAPQTPAPNRPSVGLYAAVIGGIALVAIVAALSWSSGGLPGTRNSPSATVHGQSTVGKAGGD